MATSFRACVDIASSRSGSSPFCLSREANPRRWFDISTKLKPGENYIAVELDNRPTLQSIPGVSLREARTWYGWFNYGGMVRDVWLSISGEDLIRSQKITTRLAPYTAPGSASVTSQVVAENHHRAASKVALQMIAYAPDGSVGGRSDKVAIHLAAGQSLAVALTLQVMRTLTVKVLDPQGLVAGEMSLDAFKGIFGGQAVPTYPDQR